MLAGVRNFFSRNFEALFETIPGQIPSLDGLRSIAIVAVIASHVKVDFLFAGGVANPSWWFNDVVSWFWIGVDLFFVMSGFLIGRILFTEYKKTGNLNLGAFLLKRGFRIWPLYFFICTVSLLLITHSHGFPHWTKVVPDYLFLANYFGENLAFGSWSLSIEEQFYILASGFLFLSRKWVKGAERIVFVLALVLLAEPIIRNIMWDHFIVTGMDPVLLERDIIHNYIISHCDGIVMGLILASVMVFLKPTKKVEKRVTLSLIGATVVTALLASFYRIAFLYSFIAAIFGLVVWFCLAKPGHPVTRFLSWKPFQILSRLSYGMYLWYRFPLWKIARVVMDHFPNSSSIVQYGIIYGITFGFSVFASTGTFILVERPFLEWRAKKYAKGDKKSVQGVPVVARSANALG